MTTLFLYTPQKLIYNFLQLPLKHQTIMHHYIENHTVRAFLEECLDICNNEKQQIVVQKAKTHITCSIH